MAGPDVVTACHALRVRPVGDVPGVAALLADGWAVVEPDLWEEWPQALRRTVPDTRPEMARSSFPEERDVRLVRPPGPRLTVDDVRVLLREVLGEPELADVPEDGPPDPALLRWRDDRAALLREPVDALVDRWHTAGPGGRLHAAWEAAGVGAVESSPWRSRGAPLPLRDAWRAAGVADEEALAWLEWRPEPVGPDVRAAFVEAADGDVQEALRWSRAGITAQDVALWRRAGLGPEAPRVFRSLGAVEPYREVGLSADEATEAAGAQLSAADAVRWQAAGGAAGGGDVLAGRGESRGRGPLAVRRLRARRRPDVGERRLDAAGRPACLRRGAGAPAELRRHRPGGRDAGGDAAAPRVPAGSLRVAGPHPADPPTWTPPRSRPARRGSPASEVRTAAALRDPVVEGGFASAQGRATTPRSVQPLPGIIDLMAATPLRDVPDDVMDHYTRRAAEEGVSRNALLVRVLVDGARRDERGPPAAGRAAGVGGAHARPPGPDRHARRLVVTTWLVDKSAYVRLGASSDAATWLDRLDRGLLHVATVTRLEIGYSIRGSQDLAAEDAGALGRLVPVSATPRVDARAVAVQRALTVRGLHRAPSVADLLVAATAEVLGHVVLHLDKDFEVLAEVTGQEVERLAPPP